ncbi:MAG: hypothetical protein HYV33_04915 [Candidatus Kerfeldbacteria bacterium]|nr:hypothetical protein [Candidatus Kerfeldbacteria bacterium]
MMQRFVALVIMLLVWPIIGVGAQALPNITVQALQDNEPIVSTSTDGAIVVQTTQSIGLESFSEPPMNPVIQFSGNQAEPGSVIRVFFRDLPVAKTSIVATDGSWLIDFEADRLTDGNHTAAVEVITEAGVSDAQTVASFTVNRAQTLSDATWLFLLTTAVAIICLLLAVTIQLRHNMQPLPRGVLL